MKNVLPDNGGRRSEIDRRQFSFLISVILSLNQTSHFLPVKSTDTQSVAFPFSSGLHTVG